jgi:uncharacterized membrane protein
VKPLARTLVGTAAVWHFRLAAGAFGAAIAGELACQAMLGPAGAGVWGWLAFLAAAGWVVGLVWRERVGVLRAWLCCAWVMTMSLCAMRLAARSGFLFGQIEFPGHEPLSIAQVPVTVPLLWWLIVGGSYPVVEELWGELRAGVSVFTALVTVQVALMVLPVVGNLRDYWSWPEGGAYLGMPWSGLAAWFMLGLVLTLGLVIMGDNWSSAEARTRRQAWTPAAVLLALTVVCLGANLLGRLWLAATFSAANAVLFGAVVVWYLRDRRE